MYRNSTIAALLLLASAASAFASDLSPMGSTSSTDFRARLEEAKRCSAVNFALVTLTPPGVRDTAYETHLTASGAWQGEVQMLAEKVDEDHMLHQQQIDPYIGQYRQAATAGNPVVDLDIAHCKSAEARRLFRPF